MPVPPIQMMPGVSWELVPGHPTTKRWSAHAIGSDKDLGAVSSAVHAWMAAHVPGNHRITDGPVIGGMTPPAADSSLPTGNEMIAIYWYTDMSADTALKYRARSQPAR